MKLTVIKKNGTSEPFNIKKIFIAVNKSATRVNIVFTDEEFRKLEDLILKQVGDNTEINVSTLHGIVERTLEDVNSRVAKSYRDYRNYKKEFVHGVIDDIEIQTTRTLTEVDRSNSNSNTRYISTKRTEVAKIFSKEMYQKMHLSLKERQAIKDGFIYIHDLSDMLLPQFNCCLADAASILKGGFELEGVKYREPRDIRVAIGQLGDIIMIISSQHFGGHTTPRVDRVLAPYYKMSINKYEEKYKNLGIQNYKDIARQDAYNDLKQSLQGLEIKLNTVVSARGAYPFVSFSFGDAENEFEADVSKAILEVRMEGHGEPGKKRVLIFPKLIFLYDFEKHDEGKEYEWLFNLATLCSSKNMYPDYLSPKYHKREGKYVSPMG